MTGSSLAPSAEVATLLRAAVFTHATTERRRIFGPVLHIGLPGTAHASTPALLEGEADSALRRDVVASMLTAHRRSGATTPPVAWLTRTGELALHDADAAWLGPVAAAFAEADLPECFAVVTKQGWWHPRSGVRRVWKRPRVR
jgi:hypothetical protein